MADRWLNDRRKEAGLAGSPQEIVARALAWRPSNPEQAAKLLLGSNPIGMSALALEKPGGMALKGDQGAGRAAGRRPAGAGGRVAGAPDRTLQPRRHRRDA